MTRFLLSLALLALCAAPTLAEAQSVRVGARITTQTTTIVIAAVASKTVAVTYLSICLDSGATATGVALQDTAGTNIVGTGIVYLLAAGQCLVFPSRNDPYFVLTASGTGLQIVSSAANGPLNVYIEALQR